MPALITHTIVRSYASNNGILTTLTEKPVGNAEINYVADPSLPVAANTPVHIAITRANLVSLSFSASGPCTVYTNNPSGSSPQDTIVLVGGQVCVWTLATDQLGVNAFDTCPFSGNVTAMYVTNAGSGAINFAFSALVNQ